MGLRPLAAHLLGGRVSKTWKVTNWENPELKEAQIRYAATDAWISRTLWQKAKSKLKNCNMFEAKELENEWNLDKINEFFPKQKLKLVLDDFCKRQFDLENGGSIKYD